MEGKTKLSKNDNNNKNRKQVVISKIEKIKINLSFCKMYNFIFFEIFLILLLKIIRCSEKNYYVEIKVNYKGYNQILSDEYKGASPTKIYINGNSFLMENKIVYVESTDYIIHLKWGEPISNFSYMFNNLSTITSVHMNYMFGQNNNMSYMFYNCYNLENFTYVINYDSSYAIIDMASMFYNCISLLSFHFNIYI